jgi:hypothetical protein
MLLREYQVQLDHRRRIELAYVRLAFFGPILGFIVVLSFLGTAAWLIYEGHGIEGTFLGTVDIASLAAVFVLGLQQRFAPAESFKVRTVGAEPKLEPEPKASWLASANFRHSRWLGRKAEHREKIESSEYFYSQATRPRCQPFLIRHQGAFFDERRVGDQGIPRVANAAGAQHLEC